MSESQRSIKGFCNFMDENFQILYHILNFQPIYLLYLICINIINIMGIKRKKKKSLPINIVFEDLFFVFIIIYIYIYFAF
jgi:hypothetical protein